MRIFRKLAQLLDVDLESTPPNDGDALTYDDGTSKWVPTAGGGGGGAPTTVDYLVGTAAGGLSAEIVVGTSPGGELGGTWASPTVDATHSGSSHASVQAAAEATAAADLDAHEADTTSVHGITDTSALALTANVPSNATFNDHSARHENGGADEISIAGLDGTPTDLQAHIDDTTAAHAGTAISNTAAGGISATTVQAAINELDTEKAAASHVHAGEDITSGTVADARIASTIARDSEVTSAISALSSVYQPLDSDLTTYAGITPSANVQSLLGAANYAAMRTLLDTPTNAEAVLDSLVDAKGDLLAGTADNTVARVAVGATNGMVLEVASGATPGVQWDLPPGWEYDYVQNTSDTAITASSEATATSVITGNAVTYDGSTTVMIEFFAPLFTAGATTTDIFVCLYDGSSSIGILLWARNVVSGNGGGLHLYGQRRLTPSAAAHTYSIRAYSSVGGGGSATVYSGAGGTGSRVPAHYRITKV